MHSPLFSLIVPIYNVKEYVERTIISIRNQTFSNFEVLVIDDGSTDGSGDILKAFAKIDKRIKIFHQENKGVSEARNIGLNKAIGKWIIFVDGDDGLKKNALEIIKNHISRHQNVDLIGFSFEKVSDLNKINELENNSKTTIFNNKYNVSFNSLNHYTVWSLAIKKDLIGNLRFYSLKNGEDVLFCNTIGIRSNYYTELNASLYLYLQRESSAKNNKWSNRRFEDYETLHYGILSNLKNSTKTIESLWIKRWIGNLLLFTPEIWQLDKFNQNKFFSKHRNLLKETRKLHGINKYLKFWISCSLFVNSKKWFNLVAMKPIELYAKKIVKRNI